ncbi:MAG: PEP-CTERM/exosortase system-associated acyltransferase [Methylobacter sp.]|nr:PEP-CTERM/exosortase system-associated acyltransferase [Methylobacter sp.]
MQKMNDTYIFNKYFEMIPATSDELKHEVYKLRYQVYSTENGDKTGFNKFINHADGMEFDEYDLHSSHYLIRHRELGMYMATTRLILPDVNIREKLFPIEQHSQIDNVDLLKTMPRHNLAELSRFCISKEFRRRRIDQYLFANNDDSENLLAYEEKRSSSHLTLALFSCAIKMSAENNIHYWYAFMEPALIRVFSAFGIHFVEIGPLVDFYGMRRPCVIKVADLLDSVAKKDLNYWSMLTNSGQFRPR